MGTLDTFENIKGKSFCFSDCSICDARCCDGRRGSVHAPILLDDFADVYQHFPIVFTFGERGILWANILLNDGTGYCRFVKDNRCTIHEKRPSICRFYPLSPHLENQIFIDKRCPAVQETGGTPIVDNGKVTPPFQHPLMTDYHTKLVETLKFLIQLNKPDDFELILKINGIAYHSYIGTADNDYIKMHLTSLKNLPLQH
jgi:Fe-S-cluster containining protein